MRVLCLGASGFLGRHLVPALVARGDEVVAPDHDAWDYRLPFNPRTDKMWLEPFDRIFHLAAYTQAGDWCLTHPGEQWLVNQKINTNVLDYWKTHQPQAKMIAMGTSCAHGGIPVRGGYREENFFDGEPADRNLFTYGMTKRMLAAGMHAIGKQYGLEYLCCVPSTLYGPDYPLKDGKQMHFIFDLIRKIHDGKTRGAPVVLWGDGNQRRELIHVRDFVDIMLRLDALPQERFGQGKHIVNVSGGYDYTIRYYARKISEILGYDPEKIQYNHDAYIGVVNKKLDIEYLFRLLGEPKMTSLEDGLKETVDWYIEQMKVTA